MSLIISDLVMHCNMVCNSFKNDLAFLVYVIIFFSKYYVEGLVLYLHPAPALVLHVETSVCYSKSQAYFLSKLRYNFSEALFLF